MDLPELIKPNGVYVADHHSLMDLVNAIVYTGESLASLRSAVDGYFRSIENAMENSIDDFRRQLQDAQSRLSDARAALSACEDSGYYDDDGNYVRPNCSCERAEVREAESEVDRIRKILERLEAIKSKVDSELYKYRQPFGVVIPGGGDGVLEYLSDNQSKEASDFMNRLLEIIEEYLSVNVSADGGVTSTPPKEEPIEITRSKADAFREASVRVMERQRTEQPSSHPNNAVALCLGCGRPVVACICANGPLQRERIFNYDISR